jgi:transcriptional regulator with XRE-family HTH domain
MPRKIGPKKPVRNYIADHRLASNLTQKQLSERLGCDVMTISRWEAPHSRVGIGTLQAIAEALPGNLEGEDLLHHPDQPSPNQLLRNQSAEIQQQAISIIMAIRKTGEQK